jgi:hypothetical protein
MILEALKVFVAEFLVTGIKTALKKINSCSLIVCMHKEEKAL